MEIRATDAYRAANVVVEALLDNKGVMSDGRSVILLEDSTLAKTKAKDLEQVVATLIFMIKEEVHQYNIKPEENMGWFVDKKEKAAIQKKNSKLFEEMLAILQSSIPTELRVAHMLEVLCENLPTPEPFKSNEEFANVYATADAALNKDELDPVDIVAAGEFWRRAVASKRFIETKRLNCPTWEAGAIPDTERAGKAVEFTDAILARLVSKLQGLSGKAPPKNPVATSAAPTVPLIDLPPVVEEPPESEPELEVEPTVQLRVSSARPASQMDSLYPLRRAASAR